MIPVPRQLGGWSDDARAAITSNPDYFVWWYTTKSLLLVAATCALAYTLGKQKGQRGQRAFGRRVRYDGFSGLSDSTLPWLLGGAALLLFSQREAIVDVVTNKLVRNRSKADGINPLLQAALDEWDRSGPFPITIGSGVRTNAEQYVLWLLGRDANGNVVDPSKKATNAKDTIQTAHGIRSGYGNAFDFDPVAQGTADYQNKQQIAGEWFEARGFEWGGRWLNAFPPTAGNPLGGDRRHIDVKGWQNIPV